MPATLNPPRLSTLADRAAQSIERQSGTELDDEQRQALHGIIASLFFIEPETGDNGQNYRCQWWKGSQESDRLIEEAARLFIEGGQEETEPPKAAKPKRSKAKKTSQPKVATDDEPEKTVQIDRGVKIND